MNLFTKLRTYAALVALVVFSSLGIAQVPDQFSDSAILQLNLKQHAAMVATSNDLAIAKYKLDFSNWARNVDNLAAAHLPAVDAPLPPRITLFDPAKFATIFTKYVDTCIASAAQGQACGELDPSSAFTVEHYPALNLPAPKPVPAQPENPVCGAMGGIYYSACPGDVLPNGARFKNAITGVEFLKFIITRPFGDSIWWQVAN